MKLLDYIISDKAIEEIIEIFGPLIQQILLTKTGKLIPNIIHSLNPNKLSFIFATLAWKAMIDEGFKNSLLDIKLKYYKRNLAILEILADKQDLPTNANLAFKIVRENLNLEHISKQIDIYNWYSIYIIKRLTKQLLEEVFS